MRGAKSTCAALTALFWLVGFDVLPLGHMVFHDLLEDHHHGHGHHHEPDDTGAGDAPTPTEHGDGSLAHKDLAANVPAPALPVVLEALACAGLVTDFTAIAQPLDRTPRTTRARAPPPLMAYAIFR